MSRRRRIYMPLLEVEVELGVLEEHLSIIEGHLERSIRTATCELRSEIQGLTPDDYDQWDIPHQLHDYKVEITLPRILRNPFLVSLFAVYESAVETVAELVQKEKGQARSLNDTRGNFLERAEKYYRCDLQFDLSTDDERWERLIVLSRLRNAIAHTNGRWEAIEKKTRCRLLKQEGVEEYLGFVIVSETFLRETVAMVKGELEDLLKRYEEWETARNPRRQMKK